MEDEELSAAVVVATRDRPASLARLLASVPSGIAVVVADSASSTTETAEVARAAGAVFVRCEQPGASLARNTGAAAAGPVTVLVFVDDDVEVGPTSLAAAVGGLEDPEVALVAGRVVPGPGAEDTPVQRVDVEPARYRWPVDPGDIGHGAALAVRAEAFAAVGGFSEDMGPATSGVSAEDHDLMVRLLVRGWAAAYEPAFEVVHHDVRTRGAAVKRAYAFGVGAGVMADRMAAHDPALAARYRRRRWWTQGLAEVPASLRRGWWKAAAIHVALAAGTAVGGLRARRARPGPDRPAPR